MPVHIHFSSDDDIEEDTRPPTLPFGSTCYPELAYKAAVDMTPPNSTYVYGLACSSTAPCVAASTSIHTVNLYSCDGSTLRQASVLAGHGDTITDLTFDNSIPSTSALTLMSSSVDGTVRTWDARTSSQVQMFQVHGSSIFSLAVGGNMLVAGCDGKIVFWDRRTGKQMGRFEDTHMDDVNQVKLHPSQKLISASEDGLVAVHDVAGKLDEDDGFEAALNCNNSVAELGMYGAGGELLWLRTGTETLHLWEWIKATSDDTDGGDVAFANLDAARHDCAQSAAGTSSEALLAQVDYLVGCHWDEGRGSLTLLAGTSEGCLGFFPLQGAVPAAVNGADASSSSPGATPVTVLAPELVLTGGHQSIVRAARALPASVVGAPCAVTGGEDGSVCLWRLDRGGAPPHTLAISLDPMDADDGAPVGGKFVGPGGGSARARAAPY